MGMEVGGLCFPKEGISSMGHGCCALCGSLRRLPQGGGGTDSFPEGCLCFQLFSQAEGTGCHSPATSAAPPQLHAFIFSLHNSWKSLLSLSMAGPCAQQLNYPQDLRAPDCSSDDRPKQPHRYCLLQKSHVPVFICIQRISQHQFATSMYVCWSLNNAP